MARMSKEDRLASIHQEALKEFDEIQPAVRDERLQCLQDRRFYSVAGAQWEGPLGQQFENKPKFEVNKIHLSVIRVFNEYRNNRITVNFISKDGAESDTLADTLDGLYRADEQDSVAEEAYDNAFEEAVGGGFGAWRLRAEYEDDEDEDNERQRICIEPIFDADSSVFFDLQAKRQDKADAKRCFVLTSMTPEGYRDEYGEEPATFPKEIQEVEFDWTTPDVVYIAEYYRVEETKENVYTYQSAITGDEEKYKDADFERDESLEETLKATGYKLVRTKQCKRKRIHKYIMSGAKILEDCGYIAGKCIPIVPMYGKRWFVDNVERCMGHVRLAKDAQRLANTLRSKLGEISALSSVRKPIFTPEQMLGHTEMWRQDNVLNYPYLLVNAVTDANGNSVPSGPIGYTEPPAIPPALAALMQITEQDMQDLLGNQQNAEEMVSNISGKAVEMIQNRLDMQSFIYMSNMAKAVKRSGEIWLSMASELMVEEGRKMQTIGLNGESGQVELLRPVVGEEGGIEYENDLSKANMKVVVDIGPSSSSKRQSTVRALTGMMAISQDPETVQVLGAMAMLNMEGEGIGEVRSYFRSKLIKMGVVKPNEEEAKRLAEELQNTPPDPNAEYLKAAAQQAEAEATKARADTVLTIAKAEETNAKADQSRAETVKTLSEVETDRQQVALETIKSFDELQKSVNTQAGTVQPQ